MSFPKKLNIFQCNETNAYVICISLQKFKNFTSNHIWHGKESKMVRHWILISCKILWQKNNSFPHCVCVMYKQLICKWIWDAKAEKCSFIANPFCKIVKKNVSMKSINFQFAFLTFLDLLLKYFFIENCV